jgi:secondary thiamine-phosphate synthase enzyme
MQTYQDRISISTEGHRSMHDLTGEVSSIVRLSGVTTGLVNVHVIGSTAAVGTIEFEPGLREDLPAMLDKLFPPSHEYGHEQAWHDGNGHSHLQATTVGSSLTIPIAEREPILGTWQQIFLLECDITPRQRTIVVTVMGS